MVSKEEFAAIQSDFVESQEFTELAEFYPTFRESGFHFLRIFRGGKSAAVAFCG